MPRARNVSAVSQQVNSSVRDTAQPLSAGTAAAPNLPAAQPLNTQLDRIDALLAAQRAQQVQLGQALKAAKTSLPSGTQADINQAWGMPELTENGPWFAASGMVVVLLCIGFFSMRRGRLARKAARQSAAQDSISDNLLLASDYNALQPLDAALPEPVMSQPKLSNLAAFKQADKQQHIDVELDIELDVFDVSVTGVTQAHTESPNAEATSDFVSDEVRKVQQSLAHKRSLRKTQQRALQPEVLLETVEPTPEQVLASAFAPPPVAALHLAAPIQSPVPVIFSTKLTDDDAQWTVQLHLAQEMADLGRAEDAQALCQEVFVRGSENMQSVALQIMTRLPNFKQP